MKTFVVTVIIVVEMAVISLRRHRRHRRLRRSFFGPCSIGVGIGLRHHH